MSRAHKKHLDFELNLVPFIDLLSVCICFLLMTAVWNQVGSMDAKQAIGGQPAAESEKKATIWAYLTETGNLDVEVKDSRAGKGGITKARIPAVENKPDWAQFETLIEQIKVQDPGISTALIQPKAVSALEEIVEVMDKFRKHGVMNLGVSPL